jgi:hypothetical protein
LVIGVIGIESIASRSKLGTIPTVTGVITGFTVDAEGIFVIVAFVGSVSVAAGAAYVVLCFTGAGDMSPVLAADASNGLLLVFARVQFFFVEDKSVLYKRVSVLGV